MSNKKMAQMLSIMSVLGDGTATDKVKPEPSKVYERKEPAKPLESTRVRKVRTHPRKIRRR
jgi:hypothetical protein